MKAVLLAGGLGTRMREETEFRPKPMVEIGGKPVLWHLMKFFSAFGLTDFVICAGYKGEQIKEYFLNCAAHNNDFTITFGKTSNLAFHGDHMESDWHVTVADTGRATLTAGRVERIECFVQDERFIVTCGDGLADLDMAGLLAFHEDHGRKATITTVRLLSRFGPVDVQESKAHSLEVIDLAFMGIFAHSYVPLRLITVTGISVSLISVVMLVAFSVRFVISGVLFAGYGTLFGFVLLLFGILFMMIGVVSEYVGLIYEEVKQRPNFIVRRKVGL